MNRDTLLKKRDEITKAFEERGKEKLEVESEQLRLQGEYRLVEQLLEIAESDTIEGEVMEDKE